MQTTDTTAALVATVAASEAPAKQPKAKRAPRKAKAAKPSKPAAKPNGEAKRNETAERCIANRAIVQPHYNGPSLATHRTVAPKLADALNRIADPIQRAKSATTRDESALALLAKRADGNGTFCPVDCTADLGALSRLASLKLIAPHNDKRAKLTKAGRDLAALIAKRAA